MLLSPRSTKVYVFFDTARFRLPARADPVALSIVTGRHSASATTSSQTVAAVAMMALGRGPSTPKDPMPTPLARDGEAGISRRSRGLRAEGPVDDDGQPISGSVARFLDQADF